MINTIYRLVAPRRFEIAFEDINMFGENAIVDLQIFLSAMPI